jgi:hypothetical protein
MLFRIMTLSTLDELTEEELGISLYVVNILSPIKPPIEINARGLTWFPHDTLVKKLLDAFPLIIPEYHPIFQGLMAKLGVKIEIQVMPPTPEAVQSELTSSVDIPMESSGSMVPPAQESSGSYDITPD